MTFIKHVEDSSDTEPVVEECMLTTIDNPFNPFTQFDEWYGYDMSMGYNSCAYLARILIDSAELSEADQAAAAEQAIDEIVSMNVLGIYQKVTKDSFKNRGTKPT